MLTVLTDSAGKSGNKLLSLAADCRQLTDRRANTRSVLDDYVQRGAHSTDGQYEPEPVKTTRAALSARR